MADNFEIKFKLDDGGLSKEIQKLNKNLQSITNTTSELTKEEKQVEQVDTSSEKIEEPVAETQESLKQEEGIKDTDILKYIKDRYDKEISSVDDLCTQREANEDLKKLLKSKQISEDEEKTSEKSVQTITDNHIKVVD